MHYEDEAGRAAYLAGLHAAQALISERTGRIARTHEGVSSRFQLLTRGEPLIDDEVRAFLSRSYSLEAIADYETGPEAVVSADQAQNAIATAERVLPSSPNFSRSELWTCRAWSCLPLLPSRGRRAFSENARDG